MEALRETVYPVSPLGHKHDKEVTCIKDGKGATFAWDGIKGGYAEVRRLSKEEVDKHNLQVMPESPVRRIRRRDLRRLHLQQGSPYLGK